MSASLRQKSALTTFINILEENFSKVLLEWNKRRSSVFLNKDKDNSCISNYKIKQEVNQKSEKAKWDKLSENLTTQFEKRTKDSSKNLKISDPIEIIGYLRKNLPVPVTLINTRDCFAYDLKYTEEKLNLGEGREEVIRKKYYFDPEIDNGYPENFKSVR